MKWVCKRLGYVKSFIFFGFTDEQLKAIFPNKHTAQET